LTVYTVQRVMNNMLAVKEIRLRDVPREQAAIMARSGQIDCGKRQVLVTVSIEDEYAMRHLAMQPAGSRPLEIGDPVEFHDGEGSMEEAEDAIRLLIEIEQAAGREACRGEIDYNIPTE